MNTANLENCKKLYELSGWTEANNFWMLMVSGDWRIIPPDYPAEIEINKACYPAYDLGYLLRKLQPELEYLRPNTVQTGWVAKWVETNSEKDLIFAYTPEDAACLLAIKLFEEGILEPPKEVE